MIVNNQAEASLLYETNAHKELLDWGPAVMITNIFQRSIQIPQETDRNTINHFDLTQPVCLRRLSVSSDGRAGANGV